MSDDKIGVAVIADCCLCAVVVTYRPSRDVIANLAMVRSQVHGLVVVDNGSSESELQFLLDASADLNFALIPNRKNLGIAAALNQGVRHAELEGYNKVILFDQDSVVTHGFIATMLQYYLDNPRRDRLAMLVPRYVDRRSGIPLPAKYVRGGGLGLSMCSGNLMPISVFREQGWFREELFIDYVDYEYCLRVRSCGYLIEECSAALLMHAPADPQLHRLFGLVPVRTANYSAFRRYFLERNMVWIVRKYGRMYPVLCINMFFNSVKDCIKILLVEDNRWEKLYCSLRGLSDGVRGRMGMNIKC